MNFQSLVHSPSRLRGDSAPPLPDPASLPPAAAGGRAEAGSACLLLPSPSLSFPCLQTMVAVPPRPSPPAAVGGRIRPPLRRIYPHHGRICSWPPSPGGCRGIPAHSGWPPPPLGTAACSPAALRRPRLPSPLVGVRPGVAAPGRASRPPPTSGDLAAAGATRGPWPLLLASGARVACAFVRLAAPSRRRAVASGPWDPLPVAAGWGLGLLPLAAAHGRCGSWGCRCRLGRHSLALPSVDARGERTSSCSQELRAKALSSAVLDHQRRRLRASFPSLEALL